MRETYTGNCLCGDVTYVAKGAPVVVARCHCEACRRLSGAGHSTGAMFRSEAVEISGKVATFTYTSDTGSDVTKAACPRCYSPIYGANTRLPEHITLTLGTMNTAEALSVAVVIFARDKPQWDALPEQVTVFETQPDWTPAG